MLISTSNDLPGCTVTSVPGEEFGVTPRSRHSGSRFDTSETAGTWTESCAFATTVVSEPLG